MKGEVLTLNIDDNHIAWVSIDVKSASMNVLGPESMQELATVLDEIESQHDLTGVVFVSGKEDSFIAGADVNMLAACQSAEEAQHLAQTGQTLFQRIEDLNVTTVVAIHGLCLGGGLEMALACDYRIISNDASTRLGLPEVQLGLLPGSSGTQRLPKLVGLVTALDMILTGKQVRARPAVKKGLADEAVDVEILHQVAADYVNKPKPKRRLPITQRILMQPEWVRQQVFTKAKKTAEQKARGNYPAIDLILKAIDAGFGSHRATGYQTEAELFAQLVMTPQSHALRSIFFASTELKKDSVVETPAQPIEKVAVLGAGLMGSGIAMVSASKAGLDTRIKDLSQDALLGAHAYLYKRLNKQRRRRFIRYAGMQKQLNNLSATQDNSGLKRADIVVEAVFEDLALKQSMLADIEALGNKNTVFASNTSSIPIAKIAEGAARPEQVIGLHYFSPVEKMPLVEIIPHHTTNDQTIANTLALAKKQGKTAIVVKDSAGFYVNRILTPYLSEAMHTLLQGAAIERIDDALLDAGFPVGPFTLLDEVGIDVGSKILPIMIDELGERFKAPEVKQKDVFEVLLKDGRKGRKSSKGFYHYKNAKKSQADSAVYTLLNCKSDREFDSADISEPCLLTMLNEAVRCLDEQVIRSPRDGDIGAIFGIGFPPFLGGPFRYMDSMGIDHVVERLRHLQQKRGDRFAPCDGLLKRAEQGGSFYG